jgi:hypothetical protein
LSSSSKPEVERVSFSMRDAQKTAWPKTVEGTKAASRPQVESLLRDAVASRFPNARHVDVALVAPHTIDAWDPKRMWLRSFGEVRIDGEFKGTLIVDASNGQAKLGEWQPSRESRERAVHDDDDDRSATSADGADWRAPIAIAPGTFYTPVSPVDAMIVRSNPAARSLLAANTAVKTGAASLQQAAVGNQFGAAMAAQGAFQAWLGVFGVR